MMAVVDYIIYAFAACITIFIVPGQLFFISIHEGTKSARSGVTVLLGVLASELLLICTLLSGFLNLLIPYLPILKVVGAALLVLLGLSAIRSALRPPAIRSPNRHVSRSFFLGFLFAFLNPPFTVWFLTVGVSVLNVGLVSIGLLAYPIFVLALLSSTIMVTLTIVLLTAKGHKSISGRGLRILSALSGIAFFVLAINVILN